MLSYIQGAITLDEAIRLIKTNTKRYAKRQLTWFRGLKYVRWFECRDIADAVRLVEPLLRQVLTER